MVAQILKEMVSFCVTKLNVKQSLFLIEYNVVVVFFYVELVFVWIRVRQRNEVFKVKKLFLRNSIGTNRPLRVFGDAVTHAIK